MRCKHLPETVDHAQKFAETATLILAQVGRADYKVYLNNITFPTPETIIAEYRIKWDGDDTTPAYERDTNDESRLIKAGKTAATAP